MLLKGNQYSLLVFKKEGEALQMHSKFAFLKVNLRSVHIYIHISMEKTTLVLGLTVVHD